MAPANAGDALQHDRHPIAERRYRGPRLQLQSRRTFSDEEIDRGFTMAKALGAETDQASLAPDVAKRVAPFADKHQMLVALSGRAGRRSRRRGRHGDLDAALTLSPYFKVNVDVGEFTASHLDPVAYIREHHAEIASVHLTDCRRDGGGAVPWGQGDAPIREVLQLLKRERWPIRAYVEYEFRGPGTPIDEVKRCLAYAKQALA